MSGAIDVRTFKRLLHIEDDDFWFNTPDFQYQTPGPYRIAGGAVRAVPLGMSVDVSSREPIRPLIRDPNYRTGMLFESLDGERPGERDELEPYNPTGAADAVLLTFPARVFDVVNFLNYADLWWSVDMELWHEIGLPAPEKTRELHDQGRRERNINRWLRGTWEDLGCPGGSEFFRRLKRFENQDKSPIVNWWQTDEGGIEYRRGNGGEGSMSRKAIQNKVSQWKRENSPITTADSGLPQKPVKPS